MLSPTCSPRSLFLAVILVLGLAAAPPASSADLFREVADATDLRSDLPLSAETRYFEVDLDAVRAALAAAPAETFPRGASGVVLEVPQPDGATKAFRMWETAVMHPDLGARYPEIRTYLGQGIDDPFASVRVSVTPAGFHAQVLSAGRTVLVDPILRGDDVHHASHYRTASVDGFSCELIADPATQAEIAALVEQRGRGLRFTGANLYTYELCVATTGEFTTFHGGTVAGGLAAVVTAVNRVTAIYEQEVAIRLQLVANNDQVIYTNGATDPYTNGNAGSMLSQNTPNLNSVIGSGNYDIGHVLGTGTSGSGVAYLGQVCRSLKGGGVTLKNAPANGGPWEIIMAHEMGHSFGANHTFNGTTGSCGTNGNTSTAYETGSGVTIMAYAGICGGHDIISQAQWIEKFHGNSFDEITAYTRTGGGNTCPTITPTGNNPPVPIAGNAGLTIPIDTPFIVYGSHTEPDGDPVTYDWEQFDLGPRGDPAAPSGNAPIFRDWAPRSDRDWRMFPRRIDVRNNTSTYGELLPTYSRIITLRLIVRDNLGGVDFDTTTLTVDGGSGPFVVTSIDAVPWNAGTMKTITWDVAGTDGAPVSVPLVNIVLSTDDGINFPEVLAANTPNDGSEVIVVPPLTTTQARVQVEAVGNVFFDLNDAAFEITNTAVDVAEVTQGDSGIRLATQPNPFVGQLDISFATDRTAPVSVDVYDAAGRRVATLLDATMDAGSHQVRWDGREASGARAGAGVYFVRMKAGAETRVQRVVRLH